MSLANSCVAVIGGRLAESAMPRAFAKGCAAWLLLLGLAFHQAASATPEVHLVLSGRDDYYQKVADDIFHHLRAGYPALALSSRFADADPLPAESGDGLFITIGTLASERIARDYPIAQQLSLLVTRESSRRMVEAPGPERRKAAIFIDQPAERYLRLARALAPEGKTFSTLFGPLSIGLRDEVTAAARKQGVDLKYGVISMDSNPVQTLSPLFDDSDAFIALPDQSLLNRSISRWVLQLGFRGKIPVIGFSRSYGEAGAAAALFTAPENAARQGIDWLEDYFAGADELWREYPPRYFTVTINRSVARGLGLPALDEEDIRERIAEPERRSDP